MREKLRCRRCEFTLGSVQAGGKRSFAIPGAQPRYAPDLLTRLEHVQLEAKVDPRTKSFEAVTRQRFRVIAPGVTRISLDQIGLTIDSVALNGKPAKYSIEGDRLHINIITEGTVPPAPGKLLELSISYRILNPVRGIYFTGPDQYYPKKHFQFWTQGQDEDARYWIPTADYPNQKATSEVIARVPKGFTAVSNGALVSRTEQGEWTRFHYSLGTPHVTYLISLVVGEFTEWNDEGPAGLPVQYFVEPDRKEDGIRAFSHTPQMIAAYALKTGVEYPYEKYSQVAVQNFIFGGMENTSATTQTDRTLHDKRAHLDYSSDPLVSHELAHQWFGDLVTCRDWSHGWLNEGFATFMERVWIESNIAEYGSIDAARDEAKYYGLADLREYIEEDSDSYRRPIVCKTFVEPMDLFDRHLYQKGGLVVNLIRSVLGDEPFWKSIQLYLTRHRGQNVETIDLLRAIEDATGRNLRRLFDEWVFNAGHPEFEVAYIWHEEKGLAEFVIEQKQTGGKPELVEEGVITPLFHLEILVELTLGNGKKIVHKVTVGGDARDRIFLPAESMPVMVRFDPEGVIPKTLKFPRSKELLVYQLAHDGECLGRIEAAQELAKIGDSEAVAALAKSALSDPFWGVQVEAAAALAEIRSDTARDGLIAAIHVAQSPKARREMARSLGFFKDIKASEILRNLASKDLSYFVEANATHAWALSRSVAGAPGSSPVVDETETFLMAQLTKESHVDVIQGAALRALGELPGIGRGERPHALATMIDWTKRGVSDEARLHAIGALGKIARTAVPSEQSRIFEVFKFLAEENDYRIRMKLVAALGEMESTEAIPLLQRIRQLDSDCRVKRLAQVTADALLGARSAPESLLAVKASLEKLEEEHRKLKERLEDHRM